MSKIDIFWNVVGIGTILGFGVFVWFLARPGFSILETIGLVVVGYAVVAFYVAWGSLPGAFAVPVKWDR